MFRKSRVSILIAACLSASVAFVSPTAAWAQDPPEYANPSEHQLTLNDDAVRAIIKGDYAGAVALLEEARSLGELNVTYLNLGRAYQKLEQCQKARDAFERALEAPPVKQPPPTFIQKKVAEYSAELDEECPEGETVEAKEADKVDKVEAPPVVEEDSSNAVAWTVTLGGVAVMAGGGAMFALASSERDKVRSQPEPDEGVVTERTMKEAAEIESRANTYDTIGVAALAGGAVITGVGAYLFVADDESSGSQTSVHLDADAVRVQWRVSF
ncbi:tetratricopeptide repeat protein [Persicimonas caeni]|uniref:Tetratricopeptide repeat protein n=1 Tax=Persicimonas caeni TaxID=2292766 RepID=A0A4Y6PRD9_PERCE|nr:tetratricopeptide repeat protein [Persicimonas caeni]QDG50902.1 tetratricopeptide repeat protein [Persicimonas caeni]QED32123.1 tetratricopeptide repeat protein [Persicimonas caeni]